MARKSIGVNLDDNDMNNLNSNFIELYNSIFLFNGGTKFIKTEHYADLSINGFKIMDNSINRRHMRDGVIDEDNLTDQMKKVLKDTQVMSFSQNFKEIKLEFELGGWGVLGGKITGDNPKQLRSNVPVYLPSSSLIKPDSSLIQYEYIVIYHNGRGEYIKRSNWTNFATEMRVNEDAIVYINIRKKDDTIMTSEDAENVQNSFNSVRLADAKPTESNNIKFNFEAGGWSANGTKLTTNNPSSIRTTNPVRLHKGTIINTKYSEEYEFDVFRVINDVLTSQRGFKQFGNNFYVNETAEYLISNRRRDGQPISKEDIDIINGLYNENLNYNDEIYSEFVNPKFELGGWLTTGVKVTGTTPVKVRNITPYYLRDGSVIVTGKTNKYYFNVMNVENGAMVSLEEKNKFGEPFTITQTGHYYISVGKVDETHMSLEDAFEISSFFNPVMYPVSTTENKNADNKFNIVGELTNFITNNLIDHFENPNTIEPQSFHDATIQLVNNNNDIATYEILGEDSYGYNLYKYEIKPQIMKFSNSWSIVPREGEGTEMKVPKVILTAGVHGQERSASYVLYHFMKHLLENPEDNPILDTLRNNVHFIFVPICCPSGFADNTYESRSEMNMNRDFPPYGEITQPETGYVKNVLDDNSDADYHIDFHNFRPYEHNNDIFGYSLTDDMFMRRLTTNTYKFVGQKWQKKDSRLPQNRLHQWGYTAAANIGTVGKYSNDVLGIPSTIIETPLDLVMLNEGRHESNVTQIGVDILSNLIISIVDARK